MSYGSDPMETSPCLAAVRDQLIWVGCCSGNLLYHMEEIWETSLCACLRCDELE